jgi:hypothetical protein
MQIKPLTEKKRRNPPSEMINKEYRNTSGSDDRRAKERVM